MRSATKGFLAGVALMLALFLALQQVVIRSSSDDIFFGFSKYVFSDTEFPWTYFGGSGRAVRYFLFPVRVKITYYDAQYHEVTRAENPGRYGAVVRLGFNGGVVSYRYLTLYRTPEKVYWGDGPGAISSVALPPGAGINPEVLHNQQAQIGEVIKNGFIGSGDVSPQFAVLLAGLSETSPHDPPAVGMNNVIARNTAWWYGLRKQLGLAPKYPYLADLPDGYDADPAKKWPLLLYLHSNACAGSDLRRVRDFELPGQIKHGLRLPAVVIAPQCPMAENWSPYALFDLLDELTAKYHIDPDRVYVAGSSGGGDMTVGLASLHPERFAAITTVAGEDDFADVTRLKDVPYWAFEGLDDPIVMPTNVSALVASIRQAGGTKVHLTLYPGLGHAAWDKAFSSDALYRWLFAQKRGEPEVITPGVPISGQ